MLNTQIRATLLLILLAAIPVTLPAWQMESGSVALPATTVGSTIWITVPLQQSYPIPPLIFALPDQGTGYPADLPAAVRVRNVSTTSFEIVQLEPPLDATDTDGSHPAMSIHYLAIEAGDHTLPDGTRLLAGTLDTIKYQAGSGISATGWETVTITPVFTNTPGILTMIQSAANDSSTPGQPSFPWLTVAVTKTKVGKFDIALERSEVNRGAVNNNETIAYLAFEPNIQGVFLANNCVNIDYETIVTTPKVKGWDNQCTTQLLNNSYSSLPNVLASKNTRNGRDGGWVRRCGLSTSQIQLAIDEDMFRNSERLHNNEVVGIFAASSDFVYDTSTIQVCSDPIRDYRMDECYWTGNIGDIKDSSVNAADSTAINGADTYETGAKMCYSGRFADPVLNARYAEVDTPFSLAADWTFSTWVQFPLDATGHQDFAGTTLHMFGSVTGVGDLAYLVLSGADLQWGVSDTTGTSLRQDLPDYPAGWKHFTAVKNGTTTRLYVDGVFVDEILLGTTGSVEMLLQSTDASPGNSQTLGANADELKIWDSVLTDQEILSLYTLENSNKNYDGSDRSCNTCGASISSNTWELVGIPADSRNPPNVDISVGDIFSAHMTGAIDADWAVFKRLYSPTDNSSSYQQLGLSDTLEFGQGYWLGSKNDATWNASPQAIVNYDSVDPACTAIRCVEIDLTSVSKNFGAPDNDPNDGAGPFRYNMTGFVGNAPIDWADCRLIVDGTAYTPSAADTAEYANKQIWQYDAISGSYSTCDDTMGVCKLLPYEGFWIELQRLSKGKVVKLLIPQD